jgi:tetratricopeptide (TPR) repeat protein
MRVVNHRFLFRLLILSLGLSGAAYGLHGYQVKRNASVLLREARVHEEQKDFNQAISFLERYLALVPNCSVGTMTELGVMQADQFRLRDAYQTLEAALRRDAKISKARLRLVQVAEQMQRYPDVRRHLLILLAERPNDGKLLAELARCQANMNEPVEAAESYQLALKQAPESAETYGEFAELLHGPLERPDEALSLLEEMVQRNPKSARAYVERGRHWLQHESEIRRSRKRKSSTSESSLKNELNPTDAVSVENSSVIGLDPLQRAMSDARTALELASEEEYVLVFAVRCLIAADEADEAQALAERTIEKFPQNPYPYGSMAQLALRTDDLPKAIAWFQRGLKAIPKQPDLVWNLADTLINDKQLEDAAKHLKQLKESGYPRVPIAYLEAKLLAQQEKWLDSSHHFQAIQPSLVEWPELAKQADLWLGTCYQRLGRNDLQLTAYRRAVSTDLSWIPARLGIADALLSTGKLDQALEEYQEIAALPGAPVSVLTQLARVAVLLNLRRNPSQRNWAFSEEVISRLQDVEPESSVATLLKAEMLVAQGNPQEAKQLLAAARDRLPESIDLWLGQIGLAQFQANEQEALQLLDDAREILGDRVPLRLAKARHLALFDRFSAVESIRKLAAETEDFSRVEILALYGGLAGLTLALGDFEETERLCTYVAVRGFAAPVTPIEQQDYSVRLYCLAGALAIHDTAARLRDNFQSSCSGLLAIASMSKDVRDFASLA